MAQKPKKTNIKRLLNRGVDAEDVNNKKDWADSKKRRGLPPPGLALPVTVRDAKTGERKPEESFNMNYWNSAAADRIKMGKEAGLSKEQIIKYVKGAAQAANESLAEEKFRKRVGLSTHRGDAVRTFNKNKKKKKKQPQKKSD